MPPAAVPVTLTAAERKILKKRARGAKRRTGTGSGRRSYWPPRVATATPGSLLSWASAPVPRASGAAGSPVTGSVA